MNDYQIIREVGKGGMGCVYEAMTSTGSRIALKMMSAKAASHPDYREMFEQEVLSLRRLTSPSIVKIIGAPFSDSSGNIYLPMEYVEGQTISQIVQQNGPYNEKEALAIFEKLLDAFIYIHSKACIHRDVKPSNVMIRPDGSVCVIDFGIAKDSKTSTGKTVGRVVGTDGYMSPEQANGYNIDHRTDIYSLGCLLHYMLSGTHAIPKQSNDYDTICTILENNFPLLSEKGISVSDKTQQAILKAVNKNMTLRFQSAEEFKEALSDSRKFKLTVGRANCDIIMRGEYVSGHHLDVVCELQNTSSHTSYMFTIRDHSTNGTGVNGRKIKNESYTFVSDHLPSMNGNNEDFPQVMIAGLPVFQLNWADVASYLFDWMDVPTCILSDMFSVPQEEGSTTPDLPTEDKLSVGYGILCFVFPIIGWILGSVWKQSAPNKAKSANKLGWIGFLTGLAFTFLTRLLASL